MLNLFSVSGNSPPARAGPLIRGKPFARLLGVLYRVLYGTGATIPLPGNGRNRVSIAKRPVYDEKA